MPDIFIDKRILVTGKKSVLYLDNPFNLTGYITDLLYLFGVTCAQNGTNIQTTLHPTTGVQLNCVELGGSLLHDTIVSGDSRTYCMKFADLSSFLVAANDGAINIDGSLTLNSTGTLEIETPTELQIKTPFIVGAGGPPNIGDVLTLLNTSTGECEWQANAAIPPQVRNGLSIDGGFVELGGDLIKNTVVDGFDGGFYRSMSFLNSETFQVQGGDFITLSCNDNISLTNANAINITCSTSGYVDISANSAGELRLRTPNVNNATSTIGQVLTLQAGTAGLAEWADFPSGLTDNIYTVDGTLQSNRLVTGGGSSLNWEELNGFTIRDAGDILVDDCNFFNVENTNSARIDVSDIITLRGANEIQLDTPGAGTATPGWVLNLVSTSGECEWVDVNTLITGSPSTDNIYTVDGTLTQNRIVSGDPINGPYTLQWRDFNTILFNDVDDFNMTDVTNARVRGDNVWLGTDLPVTGTTSIVTPNLSGASVGDILTLQDSSGRVEYQPNATTPYTVDIPGFAFTAGTPTAGWGEYVLLGSVHQKGLTPIVQIYQQGAGQSPDWYHAPPGATGAAPATDVAMVRVTGTNGNITVHVRDVSNVSYRFIVK